TAGRLESRSMFRFFRGDRSLVCLDRPLDPARYGAKAATLGQLRAWGYAVPPGYVIEAGDDLAPLLAITDPCPQRPVVVRSSAPGEDGDRLSAAGVYQSFLDITDGDRLTQAILQCFASYTQPQALQYRQDHDLGEGAMAVIVQQQVRGQFSGVAFSRDPVARWGDGVLIEALPGGADRVVSGQVTPEQYRVVVQADDLPTSAELGTDGDWRLPAALSLTVEGQGTVPSSLLQQVAYLARHLEVRYQGIPQDLEWSFDGETLWLLQSRPITNLQPIWTRKIAAEVIPGAIRPLTWSINRPLTCGVWGEIFTLVLGNRAQGLDFGATATLHHAHAYFNATLLGQIFRRMGLPPESLEFLTRGAKFSRPPLGATLANLPGLLRLLGREWALPRAFDRADREQFQPALAALAQTPPETLTAAALLDRVETILALLRQVTAYNILAPLSAALRSTLLGTPLDQLDGSQNDEVRAIADLRQLAAELGPQLSEEQRQALARSQDLRSLSADSPQGPDLIGPLDAFLADYGYLSPVGTDIAVPTWRENPQPVQALLTQLLLAPPPPAAPRPAQGTKLRLAQARFDLKGRVNTRYNRLLAELRWTILALE
ncbi:MAG: PEP/pyruvate-binding domain-containing protein, partial [Nodosilinea sp.]